MLEDMGYGNTIGAQLMDKKPEACKPDYESVIKAHKVRISKAEGLREAIFEYAGFQRLRGKIAELVGELVSEERTLSAEIEALIKQQENQA